ncbi:MAG: DUF2167 domain-containing protein [Candidatus Brevundimonas phytovorans]|nr:DUF2167 domain-containing protein [Brevundimonas sp.]WEK58035.1 MAG: DUF2167 domain-containing protein [Brevundimonas sp.]
MFKMLATVTAALCLALAAPATASVTPTPEQAAYMAAMRRLETEIQGQGGDVHLSGPKVTLRLGETYQFYDAAEARRILVDAWGNPPASTEGVLGMIFPAGKSFTGETWGAVVRYSADGYVSDDDARTIDYTELLTTIQNGEDAENREREAAGYPGLHLVGWAQAPSYDAQRHAMIWAKEIAFNGDPVPVLNYDVRVLGRRGVVSLNIISIMPELPEVKQAAEGLMATAAFDEGARYADYQAGTDQKAAYGLAGLVAGGAAVAVAKKAGLIGILLLILKKGGVFLVAGAAGAVGWVRSRLGLKKKPASRPLYEAELAPADAEPAIDAPSEDAPPHAADERPA